MSDETEETMRLIGAGLVGLASATPEATARFLHGGEPSPTVAIPGIPGTFVLLRPVGR